MNHDEHVQSREIAKLMYNSLSSTHPTVSVNGIDDTVTALRDHIGCQTILRHPIVSSSPKTVSQHRFAALYRRTTRS